MAGVRAAIQIVQSKFIGNVVTRNGIASMFAEC